MKGVSLMHTQSLFPLMILWAFFFPLQIDMKTMDDA